MTKPTKFTKYIIVGAGPAGLQMGYFLGQYGYDYRILEKSETAGSFFATQPKHRNLLSINKKYNYFTEEEFNWRHDWNSLLSHDPAMRFTEYSDDLFANADVLYRYLQDFSSHFELCIDYQTEVSKITRNKQGNFELATTTGLRYECRVLLLGLGTVMPFIPDDIEGIELATGYEHQCLDLKHYRNKRVCVIGQGNSAFETADHVAGVAAYVHVFAKQPVKFAWDTHFPGDLRAVNNNVFDMYQLKSMHAVLNPRLKKIERLDETTLQTSHEYDYPNANPPGTLKLTREYDHIIRCTGWNYVDPTLFSAELEPELQGDGKYPALNSSWESTNVNDLYFIGTAMRANDKKAASSFIHGFRYNIRTLSRLLDERYESAPSRNAAASPFELDDFLEWMYGRFSTSSALFQLFGFLCDALVFSQDMKSSTLLAELPVAYVNEHISTHRPTLLFTLEFGFDNFEEPSISFMQPSDPVDSTCAAFLHPVIRFRHGSLSDEFHFGDSLLARWDRPHGEGGAVMSNHRDFLQWLGEKLGCNYHLPALQEGGAYHKWSAQEKEMWERNQTPVAPMYKCTRPG